MIIFHDSSPQQGQLKRFYICGWVDDLSQSPFILDIESSSYHIFKLLKDRFRGIRFTYDGILGIHAGEVFGILTIEDVKFHIIYHGVVKSISLIP